MSATAFVYKWIDSLTGMMYIGAHKGTPDDGYICSSKYMMEEYSKRPQDFNREILSVGVYSDMVIFELNLLIESNAARNPLFYNKWNNVGRMFNAGHSEETKRKISVKSKGRKHTEESKLKMSNSRKGKLPWNTGQILPTEMRDKISNSHKGKKKPRSADHQQKMANSRSRTYELLTPTNTIIQIKNLNAFCKINNLQHSCLFKTLSGERKSHKKYVLLRKVS